MRTSRALLGAVTAAVATALLIGSPASAAISIDGDEVIIDSLTADYTLGRGAGGVSALTAAETYVAQFGGSGQAGEVRRQVDESANGMTRYPRLISITEPDGAEWPSEVESADGVYTMTAVAPDGLRGRQSFVFTYTVDGVVSVGDDRGPQEFGARSVRRRDDDAGGGVRTRHLRRDRGRRRNLALVGGRVCGSGGTGCRIRRAPPTEEPRRRPAPSTGLADDALETGRARLVTYACVWFWRWGCGHRSSRGARPDGAAQ